MVTPSVVGRSIAFALAVVFTATAAPAHQIAVASNNPGGTAGGEVRTMRPSRPWRFAKPRLPTGGDVVLRYAFRRLYAVSQVDGTITATSPRQLRRARVYPLGPTSEPLDIAIASPDVGYVSRRLATRLLRVDLRTGATSESVDLSSFADADGVPDLGMMEIDGTHLFVQIRRFNQDSGSGFMPPAYLAVIDLGSEQLVDVDPSTPGVQAIELEGTAPKHKMQIVAGRRMVVSASGGFFDEGGLEVINLDMLRTEGLAIREADGMVGADLGSFVMVSADRGFLVFSTDLDLSSHLFGFSLRDGVDPGTQLHVSVGYAVPSMEYDPHTERLFVPEGIFGADGINIFDAVTGERLTPKPIATTGRPTDILRLPR